MIANLVSELYLTDGTTVINLLSKQNGFCVQAWMPTVADIKNGGIFQNSPLSEGRRLVARQYDNAFENLTLAGRGGEPDLLIYQAQEIRRLLEKAVAYWTSDWQDTPVYLIARGFAETNVRYALLYDYRAPGDGNPFASPFTGPDASIFDAWPLILERGHWTETAPGVGTAVQVSGLGTFNSVTYGRAATTANEVFVANKQNKANLTHIYSFSLDEGWSGNLFGSALPYGFWSPLIAANLAVNDAVYFICQTSVTDSGPFASLVFDLSTALAGTGLVTIWEYWNGAAINLSLSGLQDYTNGLTTTGVASVHWVQASDWIAVNLQTFSADGTAPSITGFMIRLRISAITAGTSLPVQQNRQPYSITWPSVLVDEAQVGGDIPAYLLAKVTNQGDTPAAVDRLMVGLRSTARGALFEAYLNLSDEQNQSGVTVAAGTDTVFETYVPTPSGRRARYAAGGGGAITLNPRVTVTLDSTLTPSYKGLFRVFLRAVQVGGTAGQAFVRLKVALFTSTNSPYYTSNTLYTQIVNEVELFDFGQVRFPSTSEQENTDYAAVAFIVEAGAATTIPDLYFYDLIFMPLDEWAGDYLNPSADASTVLGNFTNNRRLEVDAISYPRLRHSAVLKRTNDSAVVTNWQPIAAAPPILQANAEQRIYFLAADFSGGTWQSHIENAYSLQFLRCQRYLSMRGNR